MQGTRRPRVRLVVNPVASGVTPATIAEAMLGLATECEVQRCDTERRGHATELAKEAVGAFDAVVVLAGDGTANEILNGVGAELPVGVLPGGGTSVLPRALGLPRQVGPAARRIAKALREQRVRSIALGEVNGRRFAFAAGIGLDAETVRRVDAAGRGRGRRPGDSYFAWQLGRSVASGAYATPVLTVEVDGDAPIRGASVLAANCHPWSFLGPLPIKLAPRASFDGRLDAVVPERVRLRDVPLYARYLLLTGAHSRDLDPRLRYVHDVPRITVRCDRPLPLEADGDDLGDVTEAVLTAVPGAARVLV